MVDVCDVMNTNWSVLNDLSDRPAFAVLRDLENDVDDELYLISQGWRRIFTGLNAMSGKH